MPNYVNYSPWQDAAQYGAGMGETLGKAFMQMPQQRMQLAAQMAQAQQQQQAEMMKYALQQQQVQQEGRYQNSELGLKQLEIAAQREEYKRNAIADTTKLLMERRRADLEETRAQDLHMKGEWEPYTDKETGRVGAFNKTLGKFQWEDEATPQGMGGVVVPKPATQYQRSEMQHNAIKDYAGALSSPLTNSPSIMTGLSNNAYNAVQPEGMGSLVQQQQQPTNGLPQAVSPILQALLQRRAQSLGQAVPQAQAPVTNAAPDISGYKIIPMQ